jgi:hypothetical protein
MADMSDDTPRRRFNYRQRSSEDVERRIQRAKFDEALRQAKGRNLQPLHDWLRDLLPDYADALAKFHKSRLRRDIGKRVPSAERLAEDEIIGLSIYRIKILQRRYGKLRPGSYQHLIHAATVDLAEDGELGHSDPARIDYRRILNSVRRRSSLPPLLSNSFPRVPSAERLADIFRVPSAERLAEDEIIGLSIYRIKMLQRRFRTLHPGTYKHVINESAGFLAEEGELGHSDPARIDYQRILKTVRSNFPPLRSHSFPQTRTQFGMFDAHS